LDTEPVPFVERPIATQEGSGSWFYCTEPPGYFPHVQTCGRPWMAVQPFDVGSGGAPQ
jgi:hypothetical protein